jgi:predicted RNA binding protein YcfA (HicA-like mRNA interferase family)
MRSVSGKDIAKVLERHGWSLLRVQGSHHIYGKAGSDATSFRAHPRESNTQDRFAQASNENSESLGG